MMTLDRNAMMDRLREEVLWDVCIIGGGATGLGIAFEAASAAHATEVVARTRLFSTTVSFGGLASSISLPAFMSHASIPPGLRATAHVPESLVRISIGIEDRRDLIEDLRRALDPEWSSCNEDHDAIPRVSDLLDSGAVAVPIQ